MHNLRKPVTDYLDNADKTVLPTLKPSAILATSDHHAPDHQDGNTSSSVSATAAAGGGEPSACVAPTLELGQQTDVSSQPEKRAPQFKQYDNSCLECLVVCLSICCGREEINTRRTYYPHPTSHAPSGWKESRPSCSDYINFCSDKSYCHQIVCGSYNFECPSCLKCNANCCNCDGIKSNGIDCGKALSCCGLFKNTACCNCGNSDCCRGCNTPSCNDCGKMVCCCCNIFEGCFR